MGLSAGRAGETGVDDSRRRADTVSERAEVAFLGLGIMGTAMVGRLLGAGIGTRVWNRTRSRAEPLGAVGATVTDSPAEAVRGASFVITMLTDADAVAEAMGGEHGALARMGADAVWIQMSTVGIAGIERLAASAERRGVRFVDAPVLGTRKPAESGSLRILASGPAELITRCRPVFAPLGTVMDGLGATGTGSRLKLAVNAWVLALTDATAASLALAQRMELPGELFLAAIDGTPTDSPYAHVKGAAMLRGDYAANFTVSAADKDAGLVIEASQQVGADTSLMEAIRAHLRTAADAGHGSDDMAAVYRAHRG
jgi:3-hydroxyisobutyrate dehydrogenase